MNGFGDYFAIGRGGALIGSRKFPLCDRLFVRLLSFVSKFGCQTHYFGLEELIEGINTQQRLLFAVNHISTFDLYLGFVPLGLHFKKFISALAKMELFEKPVFRYVMERSRAIPVARGRKEQENYLETIVPLIEDQVWLGAAPAGTRGYDGRIGDFSRGIGILYQNSSAEAIVPIFVTRELIPKGGLRRLFVNYGPPLRLDKGDLGKMTKREQLTNAKRITEELKEKQARLAVLMVDNVLSAYLLAMAQKDHTSLDRETLTEDIQLILTQAYGLGYFVDDRLLEGGSISRKAISRHIGFYFRYMRRRRLIRGNKLEPSTILYDFDKYMVDQTNNTEKKWKRGHRLGMNTPEPHKLAARGYVKENPTGYLANTIEHLAEINEIIETRVTYRLSCPVKQPTTT
ncbi:1-acyl-sn-glycerol-3-phosphate acyltransferase [Candidatus Woesearchaeota archaeon]|nr:1-acyl-sn-glycerol-3-phosphate acyltransferase [Candidatus Woesearchaeota archaeon]